MTLEEPLHTSVILHLGITSSRIPCTLHKKSLEMPSRFVLRRMCCVRISHMKYQDLPVLDCVGPRLESHRLAIHAFGRQYEYVVSLYFERSQYTDRMIV